MGTLANPDLRKKRILAHQAFDQIWKQGIMNRNQAYRCLALCKAALYYDFSRKFGPYAARAIRNALFDYCCKAANYRKPLFSLETTPELPVSHTEPIQLFNEAVKESLKNYHQSSSGTVQKGIYSLLKKAEGFTSADISKEFGVSPNLVRAWMSLASKKLRQDTELYKLLA